MSTIVSRTSLANWLILLALVLMWGSSFAVVKLALESVGPYWMAGFRIGVAALLLGVISTVQGKRWPRGRYEWGVVTALGLAGNAVPFVLIGWATLYVPAGTAGLMMATIPIVRRTARPQKPRPPPA